MSTKSDYAKVDYHYLVICCGGKMMLINFEGELTFPCLQTDVVTDLSVIINEFNQRYDFINYPVSPSYSESVVYKKRHCGVRRVYHYIKTELKYVHAPVTAVWIPILQVLTNKPAILSKEAMAIVRHKKLNDILRLKANYEDGYIYAHARSRRGR